MHSACRSHSSIAHYTSGNNGARRVPSLSPGTFRRASGPTPIATAKTNTRKMTGAVRISVIAVFAASDPALFEKRIAAQRRKQKKAPKWEPSNTSRR